MLWIVLNMNCFIIMKYSNVSNIDVTCLWVTLMSQVLEIYIVELVMKFFLHSPTHRVICHTGLKIKQKWLVGSCTAHAELWLFIYNSCIIIFPNGTVHNFEKLLSCQMKRREKREMSKILLSKSINLFFFNYGVTIHHNNKKNK